MRCDENVFQSEKREREKKIRNVSNKTLVSIDIEKSLKRFL